jgi:hypothetical protein
MGVFMRSMKNQTLLVLSILSLLASQAGAQSVLFDFDSTPYHTPLPIDLTVGDITANFSGTGASYSIQIANISGITPVGFAGNCIYPNSVSPSDLIVSFSQDIQDTSIMYAPSEFGCDTSATMRITGYRNGVFVATSTATAPNPGTWPTGVLTLSSPQGFNVVAIEYDAPPVCGEWGPIFVADNMTVTPLPTPAMALHTLAPCRLLDTRKSSGPDAAFPALAAQAERPFALHGRCGIPVTAKALSVNMTAVAATVAGNLVIYPGNESAPGASLLNFPLAGARANNAIVNLAPDGTVKVMNRANGTVEFILDVNGYFE